MTNRSELDRLELGPRVTRYYRYPPVVTTGFYLFDLAVHEQEGK